MLWTDVVEQHCNETTIMFVYGIVPVYVLWTVFAAILWYYIPHYSTKNDDMITTKQMQHNCLYIPGINLGVRPVNKRDVVTL